MKIYAKLCRSFRRLCRTDACSLGSILLLSCANDVPPRERICTDAAAQSCAESGSSNNDPTTATGPLPENTVWIEPFNRITHFTGNPIVSVKTFPAPGPDVLAQLAREIRLISDATEEAVVIATVAEEQATQFGTQRAVRVQPTDSLSEGWYTLEIFSLPAPLRWPDPSPFEVAEGAGRSHFRVGSEPTVLTVRLCAKDDADVVYVRLSETVVVRQPLDKHLIIRTGSGEPIACESPLDTTETAILSVECDLTGVERIEITLDEAFSSVVLPNMPAKGASAMFDLVVESLPVVLGCREFRVE